MHDDNHCLKLSAAGLDLIAEFEGYRRDAYQDIAGWWTIGYGHKLTHSELSSGKLAATDKHWREGLTKAEAKKLLRIDSGEAADCVRRLVDRPLMQGQFDALVSFVFNLGCGAFGKSTLLKRINAGQNDKVPYQLRRWVFAGGQKYEGLARRRDAEVGLWTA